jgi:hypothetical protein
MSMIPLHVPSELWNPVLGSSARKPSLPALSMLMPEAAMHKNGPLQPSKNDIRLPGKLLSMETIAVAHRVKKLSDDHLRLCILRLDPPHVLGATRRIEQIGHRLRV